MRIGFDLTPLCTPRSGVGTYTINLYQSLARRAEDQLLPLTHGPLSSELEPLNHQVVRLNKTVWMQAILPRQVARLRTDVCHFTNSVGPLYLPCPMVLTIHDMTLWLFPELHGRRRRLAMRPIIPLAARRAAAIIAVSETTKRDMMRILGLPGDKVRVIYEAAVPSFRPLRPGAALEAIRQKAELPQQFVLHVGTIEPRKNLVRLVEAYARLRSDGFAEPLVLAGQLGWKYDALLRRIEELRIADAVRFTGYVPDADLPPLMNLCGAFAYPSLHEGFGLPVIEALACGAPTVTSDRGALCEVAGDAALLADPEDVDSLTRAIGAALGDARVRASLREAGLARASAFGWDRAASRTVEVYRGALGGRVGS